MTESEWLASTDPTSMLQFLRDSGRAGDRKLRLFACACCRRISPHLIDERSRRAVEASERYADGLADVGQLRLAVDEAREAQEAIHWEGGGAVDQTAAEAVLGLGDELQVDQVAESAAEAMGESARDDAYDRIWKTPGKDNAARWAEDDAEFRAGESREKRHQADLLRDIFGNPFRATPTFDPAWNSWNDHTVRNLARAIYDERAFDRMPILADALEEARCTDADLLGNLRGPDRHVRGCWALDDDRSGNNWNASAVSAMPKTCLICEADASAKGGAYCPGCAHLFRWFRSYFAHEPEPVLEWITPELRFIDFGADSLDYMNWLLEAEEKLGVAIPDEEAERIQTVGQFLRYLRARGATWPPDRDLVLLREGGCFQNYAWVEVHRGKVGSSFPLRSDPVSGVRDRDLDG